LLKDSHFKARTTALFPVPGIADERIDSRPELEDRSGVVLKILE
jgi:hypothetical protein